MNEFEKEIEEEITYRLIGIKIDDAESILVEYLKKKFYNGWSTSYYQYSFKIDFYNDKAIIFISYLAGQYETREFTFNLSISEVFK